MKSIIYFLIKPVLFVVFITLAIPMLSLYYLSEGYLTKKTTINIIGLFLTAFFTLSLLVNYITFNQAYIGYLITVTGVLYNSFIRK